MKRNPKIIISLCGIFVFLLCVSGCGSNSGSASAQTTSKASVKKTYSSNKNATPTCPPVNREEAMSAETAEFLTGTGYHGCRPNSSAERAELAAQQIKCKNCGYRSHNGLNSLCDYCAWMEKYGGGLPPGKETTVTPEATPVPTKKPTEAPKKKDDLYDADDFVHPDDFYYDHRDDFWDYEEAEDYWEEYN